MSPPRHVAGRALLAPTPLPEPGAWWRVEGELDGLPLFARVPADDDGFEADEQAVALAAERLRHLDHPAIPRVVSVDPSAGTLLVAAPDAVPIARLLEHRHEEAFRMTPATLLDLGIALADVIVHAHERGRPHGHLSPDAVWVTATGELVVWGFAGGPDVLGPPRWWSPERARGRRASGDADQWALGAILAALITGRTPWRGDDPGGDARIGDATHLSQPVLDQWKPLGRVVERALQAEPRDRFPSVHPIRQALEAMRQRVPQPSDLRRMGEALVALHGDAPRPVLEPDPDTEETDAGHDDLGRPTTISHTPPPLDAPDPYLRSSLQPRMDFEPPTDVGTSPTRVPMFDTFADRDSVIDEPVVPPADDDLDPYTVPPSQVEAVDEVDAPALVMPTHRYDPPSLGIGAAGHRDDPPSLGLEPPSRGAEPPSLGTEPPSRGSEASSSVERAARRREAPPPEPPAPIGPVWYEKVDVARVAPVAVGTFVVLLVVFAVWRIL